MTEYLVILDKIPLTEITCPTELFDGDETTGVTFTEDTGLVIEYNKPAGALSASWQVSTEGPTGIYTVPDVCFNQNPIEVDVTYTSGNILLTCYNGLSWENMDTLSGISTFKEEAISWNMGVTPDTFTICPGVYDFSGADLSWTDPAILIVSDDIVLDGTSVTINGVSNNPTTHLENSVGIRIEGTNSEVSDFEINGFDVGILARPGTHNIHDNNINTRSDDSSGIYIDRASGLVKNNDIRCQGADGSHGIFSYSGSDLIINDNTISDCYKGINFGYTQNVVFERNIIKAGKLGVGVYGDSSSNIRAGAPGNDYSSLVYKAWVVAVTNIVLDSGKDKVSDVTYSLAASVDSGLNPDCFLLRKNKVNEFSEAGKTYNMCPETWDVSQDKTEVYYDRNTPFILMSGEGATLACEDSTTFIGYALGPGENYWDHTIGIKVDAADVEIDNCNIGEFDTNIFVTPAGDNANIHDNTIRNSAGQGGLGGIYLNNPEGAKIYNNDIIMAGGYICPLIDERSTTTDELISITVDMTSCETSNDLSEGCTKTQREERTDCTHVLRGGIASFNYLNYGKDNEIYNNEFTGWRYGMEVESGNNTKIFDNKICGGLGGILFLKIAETDVISVVLNNNDFNCPTWEMPFGVRFGRYMTGDEVTGTGNIFTSVGGFCTSKANSHDCTSGETDVINTESIIDVTITCCCDDGYTISGGECKVTTSSSPSSSPGGGTTGRSRSDTVMANKTNQTGEEETPAVAPEGDTDTQTEVTLEEDDTASWALISGILIVALIALVSVWWFKYRNQGY